MNDRDAVIARCNETDFDTMSPELFGDWVDRLPRGEFMALIALHDEYARDGKIAPPKRRVNVAPLPPHGDAWVVYTGEGDMPLPPATRCWVLFPDGDTAGPNRADAFLWGGDGQAEILAYALAEPDACPPTSHP